MTPAEFSAQVLQTAVRALEALRARGAATAWELKLDLKVSHSQLMLALGCLLHDGRVQLSPENLTYRVTLEKAPRAVAVPTQDKPAVPASAGTARP